MGNSITTCPTATTTTKGGSGGGQLCTYLSHHQIHLIQDTWDLIKGDLAKLGVIVFMR